MRRDSPSSRVIGRFRTALSPHRHHVCPPPHTLPPLLTLPGVRSPLHKFSPPADKTARIDKLAIIGYPPFLKHIPLSNLTPDRIRSFDNTRTETIQFQTPLTLIVGYNGSGKTTIIECLKYATTGDLPPNSKGGAFIHDPKLCGENEVMAQVKLSFTSLDNSRMVCTRSLQLSVKKLGRVQKSLEGQLLVVRNGERSTISSKCAELDTMMTRYLGVSKAVLEYVIFCHQDESLWPMSEPAALKKRFDEIFGALKYTKTIDNIRVLRKRKIEEQGKNLILLDQYRTDKDRAEKAKRTSDMLFEDIKEMQGRVENLTAELKRVNQQQMKLNASAQGFEETLAMLKTKRDEVATRKKSLEENEQHMEPLQESDQELEELQNNYQNRIATYNAHLENKKSEYDQTKARLEQIRSQLGANQREEGRLEAEKKAYESQLKEREDLVRELSIKHDIRGFDGELDDIQIQEFIAKIARLSKNQNLILDRVKQDSQSSISTTQSGLSSLQSKKSSLQQKKESAQTEIRNSEAKIKALQRDLGNMNAESGQELIVKDDLAKKEKRLEDTKRQIISADIDGQLSMQNAKLRDLESDIEGVNEELVQGTKNADSRAQLAILKQNVETRQKAFVSLVAAKKDKIDQTIGSNWSEESVERDLQTVLDQREEELQEAIRRREKQNQQLSQVNTKLSIANENLKKKDDEAKKCKEEVLQSWEPDADQVGPNQVDDYEKVVKDLEAQKMLVTAISLPTPC